MEKKNMSLRLGLMMVCILLAASATGTAHASAQQQTAARQINSHVGEDPYSSGCSQNSYIVNNSGVYDEHGNVLATVQMWYSISCVTNWSVMHWTSGAAIGTQVDVWEYATPTNRKCYPVDCSTSIWYIGGLSPSWTDMVDGQNVTCAFGAVIKAGVVYAGASGLCG